MLVLCLLALFQPPTLKPPAALAKPELSDRFHTRRLPAAPGTFVTQDFHRAAVQNEDKLYRFDPLNPTSPQLDILPLSKAQSAGYAQTFQGTLYHAEGRKLFKQGQGTAWFQADGSFHSFILLDEHRVALLWPQRATPDPSEGFGWEGHLTPGAESQLLEVWDVTSGLRLHQEPIPAALRTALAPFAHGPIPSLQVAQTSGHLFIYVPLTSQAFGFDTASSRLTELETPWPRLEAAWISRTLTRFPGAKGFLIPPSQIPGGSLCLSPGSGGTLMIGYPCAASKVMQTNTLKAVQGQGMLAPGEVPLVPPPMGNAPDTLLHMAEWNPESSTIRAVESKGTPRLTDVDELVRLKWYGPLQREMYVTPDREARPYEVFLNGLDQAWKERQAAKKPKPAAQ